MFERYIKTEDFLKVPISGKGYFVNIHGIIKDYNGSTIEHNLDNLGNVIVLLDWINGFKYYKLSEIIAFTFKPIHIPLNLWDRLTVMYKDGSNKNLHPSNLIWKFPIGLESNCYNGYFYIPGFSRYVLNKEGDIKCSLTNKKPGLHLDKSGYWTYSLRPDIGAWTAIGLHRLMCLTFKGYPANIDDLCTNHIDGVITNNKLENLELVTYQENLLHAFRTGLKRNNKVVIVENINTNEKQTFYGMEDCCRRLPIGRRILVKCLNNNNLFKNFKIYYEDKSKHLDNSVPATPVLVRNIYTNDVKEYSSKKQCSRDLDIPIITLNKRLKLKGQPIFREGIQLKLKSDISPWRIPVNLNTEPFHETIERRVLTRDVITGEVKEYASIISCANELNITKDAVSWRLNRIGQPVFPDNKQYKFVNDSTPWIDRKH